MAVPSRQEHSGRHVVLFDDTCGLCSRGVRFVMRHDRRRLFDFARLQSAIGRRLVEGHGGTPDVLKTMYVVANYDTAGSRALTRSAAVLFVARQLGWPWAAACALSVLPASLLDRAYEVVARNRHRVFAAPDRCAVPDPASRHRLLE